MDTEVVPANNSKEITTICDNVTSSTYIINSRVKNLKSVIPDIGTPKDNQNLRNQIQLWQQEVNQRVKTSSDDVNKLNTLARTTNKQQRLQISKVTSHCKDAVEAYCKIQQQVVQKLRFNLINSSDSSGGGNSDESNLLINQEQIQIQKNLEFENQLLLERQQSIKQVEKDIVQLNNVMKELGALVHEQEAAVDTIESRIESAYEDVQVANAELTTAAQYQSKSRKRKVILVIILAIILSVLIGIIAWSVKS